MSDQHEQDAELLEQELPVADEYREHRAGELALPEEVLPDTLIIMPIPERPFFPAQVQPVLASLEPWRETLRRVGKTPQGVMGLLWANEQLPEEADTAQLPTVGTAVKLHNPSRHGEQAQFVAQGLRRFVVKEWLTHKPPYVARVEYPQTEVVSSDEVRAYAMALLAALKELLPLNPLYGEEVKQYLGRVSPSRPALLADFAAALTSASGAQLQQVLETLPLLPRMELALYLLQKEREVAELQQQISAQVNEKVSQHQREFFLREQLKVIQKELGISKDDRTLESEEFEARMARCQPPEAVRKRFREELGKLSVLEPGSSEYAVTRNYLDWLTCVPWGVHSTDNLELARAAEVLEQHHDGLADVKERILEFLAVGAYKGEISGSIILLVGPPGVGKTSIGRSIADALGRQFYRFSVGGMRDEAEIKGHRRTYVGALPGKLVQALKECEVANPVIMLDEIDKIGASYQGDPASALLEVLDPEQNREFLDHYLDQRLDLSKVLFVCTANTLDSIPGPLLDRMEVIRLAGYITEEKIAIAKHHLWPRLLERHGVKRSQLRITKPAIRAVVEGYAREAGVRNLEKQLGRIVRKQVMQLLKQPDARLSVGRKEVVACLGQPTFSTEKPRREVGVVTGLAWTALGGATLPVECSRIHTLNRGFNLTGQLGDVMKESAQIAYSYVMANLKRYGAGEDFFNESLVHLHVPAGATPKDGPSAGITIATALLSLARHEKLRALAMTGELTLTGEVLPVGGIREKVIAARRAGISELILPQANGKDFEELPAYLKEGLTVHTVSHYQQVFECVFASNAPA